MRAFDLLRQLQAGDPNGGSFTVGHGPDRSPVHLVSGAFGIDATLRELAELEAGDYIKVYRGRDDDSIVYVEQVELTHAGFNWQPARKPEFVVG